MSSAEHDQEMPFLSHLIELRTRLLRAVAVLLLVFLAMVPFANKIYSAFAGPILKHMPEGGQMIAIEVISPFMVPVKLCFFLAVVLTAPWILYQAWAFVAPGLYRHEKRLAKPLLASATLLFYTGCAFAFFIALPAVFKFMQAFAPEGVAVMTDITKYLDFVLVMFLAFGVCFEVPVVVMILVLLGWVSIEQLKEARGYVIVGAFVVAAVVTPPDVVSQLMLAIPMCLLYEVGIIAARLLAKRQENRIAPSA